MNKETKSFKLHIFEDEFNLISDEPENHLNQAARMVDLIMREIADGIAHPNKQKVATLAALQLASQLLQSKNVFEKQQEEYHKDEQKLMAYLDKEISSLV